VFVPLPHYRRRPEAEMLERARAFHREMDPRRTTRHFAAEADEYKTYSGRMTDEWREALHPLGTDHVK
jgi:hypothetical protein